MSRIGKQPVEKPDSVEINLDGQTLTVKGPKGEISKKIPRQIQLRIDGGVVVVERKSNTKQNRALHGTYRALIQNMVLGVTEGWKKELEIVGTGYRAEGSDKEIILTIGFSHPVKIKAPEGVSFNVQKTDITVEGVDKEKVGQTAANIRKVRPPEPYKGKGIKYKDEVVLRKPGKAAKAAGAAGAA
ncbi:50S ribosomal protein L6 [Candidatus Woesebacteria bacterium]|nr:50S ribosomal protein L6 [Candidatus Woesebacteria bacterium]